MADYNSPYTGAEIDATIEKVGYMPYFEELYQGAPTNTGITLSSLAANPATGDRTGLYFVVYSDSATPISQTGIVSKVSLLYIAGETAAATGTASVGMGSTELYSHKSKFNMSGDLKIHAHAYTHVWSSGTAVDTEMYIHRIVREQRGYDAIASSSAKTLSSLGL